MRDSIVTRALGLVLVGALVTSCDGAALNAAAPTDPSPAPATARFTPEPTALPAPSAGTEVPTMGYGMYDYEATPSPAPTLAPPNYDALPFAAETPAGLVEQFLTIDAALHDPEISAAKLAYMGHLQQLALGRLSDYPDWKDTVLAGLNPTARSFVASSFEAGKQLRSMSSFVPTRLPDWKIVAPAPIPELMGYYKEAEATFGVPWPYLAAIHLVETRMGRIRGLSSAGAQGPMQFMPATWAQYGRGDVNDAHDAIMGAARYLVAAGAPGNMPRALFAYNHANAYVNALIAYADVMKADPAAYRGYWGWQVYYPTKDGPVYMPVGWIKP
jgi:soluble lytic murein transglycosylase-like protein